MTQEKPLKPAAFAEKQLIQAILDGRFSPGDTLPPERTLAGMIGVTRPTLRETLQRLAKEGWITICHGKPTRINHYLDQGGLGILKTLARFHQDLPERLIRDLLNVRTAIIPGMTAQAAQRNPGPLAAHLDQAGELADTAASFAIYDWQLQLTAARASDNPMFQLILNDFTPLYDRLGRLFFQSRASRNFSRQYYDQLALALSRPGPDIETVVRQAMHRAETRWQADNGGHHAG